jgi:diguanylate cyclase (GGDEF)-like protein
MAALEESLGTAIRAKGAELRDQGLRSRWLAAVAASYAIDTLFLAAFAALGTIAGRIALAYGVGGALFCAIFYVLTARGWNLKLRDPSMVVAQCVSGAALQIGVVALAPQICFPYLANLFTVFAFAMIWMPVRSALLVWIAGAAAVGVLLYGLAGELDLPDSTLAETTLVWLFFSAVLGRCVLLSAHAAGMRLRLTESRGRLAQSLEQIEELATHDELTKALNRRSLIARLEQERRRVARSGEPLCVALFDLDHFKDVNDHYGHAAGDEVLRRFAVIVHATMRQTDIFGRYGGEEFMLILPATARDAATPALERIRAGLRAADWSAIAAQLRVTTSAGVAELRPGETAAEALRRADAALYQAKRDGRDCVRFT